VNVWLRAFSFLSYFSSDLNRKSKDAHVIEDKFNGDDKQGFFGVYDGHGGKTAALFCQEHLHKVFLFSSLKNVMKSSNGLLLSTTDSCRGTHGIG